MRAIAGAIVIGFGAFLFERVESASPFAGLMFLVVSAMLMLFGAGTIIADCKIRGFRD
jgi:hypothetical protein